MPKHQFPLGNPGRPVGSKNKSNKFVNEAIEHVYDELGGQEGFLNWVMADPDRVDRFYSDILMKLVKREDFDGGGLNVQVNFIPNPALFNQPALTALPQAVPDADLRLAYDALSPEEKLLADQALTERGVTFNGNLRGELVFPEPDKKDVPTDVMPKKMMITSLLDDSWTGHARDQMRALLETTPEGFLQECYDRYSEKVRRQCQELQDELLDIDREHVAPAVPAPADPVDVQDAQDVSEIAGYQQKLGLKARAATVTDAKERAARWNQTLLQQLNQDPK